MLLLVVGEEVVQRVFGSLAVLLLLVREIAARLLTRTDTNNAVPSAVWNKKPSDSQSVAKHNNERRGVIKIH